MTKSRSVALLAVTLLAAIPLASAEELPEGKGKELVAARCNSCHPFFARVGSGYTAAGWHTVLRMMANQGAAIPRDELATIEQYLVKSFPERGKPAAVEIAGPVKISFKTWRVPTPGSRPHDPLAAHDGSLWYTGQMVNVLGRVDPKTGGIRQYPLKPAHSAPHGLAEDGDGRIWYTANAAALIGTLDPKTGAVTEHRMSDPAVHDPHTLVFDRHGTVWFTAQNANRVGRLAPKTGEIKLLTPPTDKARPYGIAVDPTGALFFDEFGTNGIGRIDPATLEIREYKLPDAAARPRRIAITSDGIVWYTDFARGYLGRLDPASGEVREWQSPSGPRSEPYGISVIGDVIWYSESGSTPNTVVRFDPKTATFQSWRIPGGGNIVRNTSVTRDGNLVLANSLVNTVTLVRIAK